jgi:hypothetical protein
MKNAKLHILCFAVIALLASLSHASNEPTAAEENPQDTPHMATYKVPDLDEALSKDFIKALAKLEGIISAKPAIDAGTFSVTYEPAKTDPRKIEALLAQLAPESKLDKVGLADATHSEDDCGKCPLRKKCGKHKE